VTGSDHDHVEKDDVPEGSPVGTSDEGATYNAMLAEVEAICRQVGDPQIDLDLLVRQVERGYTLIKAMRARLAATKTKIEELRITME
jgi:exodeoxyribonuclease VII small subunit